MAEYKKYTFQLTEKPAEVHGSESTTHSTWTFTAFIGDNKEQDQ